jgi:hypothetical protein
LSYQDLSDEDKLEEAIRFVAMGQPLPDTLDRFLREAGLYEAIMHPVQCLRS